MEKVGKYIYCIIRSKQDRNFGTIGIGNGDNEVVTVGYHDLSMVVSNHPMTKCVVNRQNMITHERVIEEVMKEFDSVLPVRFGTISSNADEIRNLLDSRYREFKNALIDMEYKIELGIKGIWKNMDVIFKEIVEENKEIKKVKTKIQHDSGNTNTQMRMEVGKMVKEALENKKKKEAEKIVEIFKGLYFDHRLNKTLGDEMFMNAAFLVDKGREKEFDNIMDDVSKKCEDRITFMYAGPIPPYNFVNITIYPEEWEK